MEHPPIVSAPSSPTAAESGSRCRGSGPLTRVLCSNFGGNVAQSAPFASNIRKRGPSHRLRGGDAEEVEADGEADAGGFDEPEARLGELGRDALSDHVAVVVEAVEAVGQLAHPRADLVRRALVACEEHDVGELGERAEDVELALVHELAEIDVCDRAPRDRAL